MIVLGVCRLGLIYVLLLWELQLLITHLFYYVIAIIIDNRHPYLNWKHTYSAYAKPLIYLRFIPEVLKHFFKVSRCWLAALIQLGCFSYQV